MKNKLHKVGNYFCISKTAWQNNVHILVAMFKILCRQCHENVTTVMFDTSGKLY